MPAAVPDAAARAQGQTGGAEGVAAGSPAVECTDLIVRYRSLTAVEDLSFSARRGEVVALLGPNGAGKTSTLETLEGYRQPTAGRVRVLGLDPFAGHRALVDRMGVMLQRGGVYPMLGPRRAIDLFAGYYRRPEETSSLLELLLLDRAADTPWRRLSGGEQQRLSLALALVGRPDVVFLDEPTAGVDPEGRRSIRSVIAGLRARGASVLLTTHELAEAEAVADRVVIVQRGRVVAEGTPAQLSSSVLGPATVRFGAPGGLDVAALSSVLGAPVVEEEGGRYRVDAPGTPRLTAALAGWLAEHDAVLTDLRTGRSLEETYLALVGQEAGTEATAVEVVDDTDAGPMGNRLARWRRRRSGSP